MRKFLIGFFAFVFLLAIAFFIFSKYLQNNWKPILEEKLKNSVIESSDSLYHIQYKSLDVDPLNGNLKLVNFKLIPDSAIYKKLVKENRAPNNLYQLSVDQVILTDANASKAIAEKRMSVNNILIKHPKLIITNKRFGYNDTVDTKKDKRTLYQIISKVFKEIKVNSIKLEAVDFTFINNNNQLKKTRIKNLNITVFDILIDSLSREDKSRIYYTKTIDIELPLYSIITPDKLYYLNLRDFKFSTSANVLSLGKIELKPTYNAAAFYKKVGYAKDYYNLNFNNLKLSDINFDLFLNSQILNAKSLNMRGGNISIYSNNAYPKKLTDKTGKFPHQQLLKFPLDLYINNINLAGIDIIYAEYDKISKQTGQITFNNTNGYIHNVTNIKSRISKNSLMEANLKSSIYSVAPLTVNFKFFLNNNIGTFKVKGNIGSFDGRVANKIIRPLGMAEIKSANIKKLSFNMSANQYHASSKMDFYYDDLKVNILKKNQEGKFVKQGFISKVANIFVINTSNPDKNGKFIHSTIEYKKETSSSFFSLIWKTLFAGIKESVGINKEKETKIKETASAIKSVISNLKNTIQEIKKARLLNRQKRKDRKLKEKQQESSKIDSIK